jgi:excinuclease ABC subunit B
MYADGITASMQKAMDETNRRRRIQQDYNTRHHITPQSIKKEIKAIFALQAEAEASKDRQVSEEIETFASLDDMDARIRRMEKDMQEAARDLEFEKAAELRDRIRELKQRVVFERQF